ncbi:hypothetical protein RHGRI_012775 [Rhododendron griersonianum]|uniref:RNase H type-1 domain-containing protein n=1 Tax=Rhododendron griersonianum TaxID=479676 RepID=A0AAV6KS92_9ERIC|nr:hypothetical protein RHGRI_012775 [Rhododendron griersonianum]
MRYLWMPRLVERIQAASAASASSTTTTTTTTTGQVVPPPAIYAGEFGGAQVNTSYTPENSSTGASSDSFGAQVSPASDLTDYYSNYPVNSNYNANQHYYQVNQGTYCDSLTSPSGYFNPGLEFQAVEQNSQLFDAGDISDNLWNVEDIDENGAVVEINHGRIKVLSALAAEAWAIRVAVSMAKAWGKWDASIESDCHPLVDMLQPNAKKKNWTIQALLDDIFSLSIHSNVVFNWCNRKANRCANWIACASRIGPETLDKGEGSTLQPYLDMENLEPCTIGTNNG